MHRDKVFKKDNDYHQASKELEETEKQLQLEFQKLQDQKSMIVQDVEDEKPYYKTMGEAYTAIIVSKVSAATANAQKEKEDDSEDLDSLSVKEKKKKQKERKKFNQSKFRKDVQAFYDVRKVHHNDDGDDYVEVWCFVTGWREESEVTAAHIVPKSLKSQDLNYLFGVEDDKMLKDPRNGTFFLFLKAPSLILIIIQACLYAQNLRTP